MKVEISLKQVRVIKQLIALARATLNAFDNAEERLTYLAIPLDLGGDTVNYLLDDLDELPETRINIDGTGPNKAEYILQSLIMWDVEVPNNGDSK